MMGTAWGGEVEEGRANAAGAVGVVSIEEGAVVGDFEATEDSAGPVVLVVKAVATPVFEAVVVMVIEAVVVLVRSVVRNADCAVLLWAAEAALVLAVPVESAAEAAKAAAAAGVVIELVVVELRSIIDEAGVARTKPAKASTELPEGDPRPSDWTRRTTVWKPEPGNVHWYRGVCVGVSRSDGGNGQNARAGWGRRPGQRCRRRGSRIGRPVHSRCRYCRGRRHPALCRR